MPVLILSKLCLTDKEINPLGQTGNLCLTLQLTAPRSWWLLPAKPATLLKMHSWIV